MLAAHLFCSPANCTECVENTDLVQPLSVVVEPGNYGHLKESGYDVMDEVYLDASPFDWNNDLAESPRHPKTVQRRVHGRKRSYSCEQLSAALNKEFDLGRDKGIARFADRFAKDMFTKDTFTQPEAYPNLLSARGHRGKTPNEKYWQSVYLDCMISVGDVLAVTDTRRIARIGTSGGMFGHVLVVTAVPRCIQKHTPDGSDYLCAWPAGKVREIYQVPVIESTRATQGIHETDLLLYVDPKSGKILLLGEVDKSGAMIAYDNDEPEQVELWQCPPELKDSSCRDLKEAVIDEMKKNQANWSWGTAVKAFLLPAANGPLAAQSVSGRQQLLKELQACWEGAPICTSLPIIFWQRYLYKLSDSGRLAEAEAPLNSMSPIDLILMYMPLKADRALPGDLLNFMRTSGWTNIQQLPTKTNSMNADGAMMPRRKSNPQ